MLERGKTYVGDLIIPDPRGSEKVEFKFIVLIPVDHSEMYIATDNYDLPNEDDIGTLLEMSADDYTSDLFPSEEETKEMERLDNMVKHCFRYGRYWEYSGYKLKNIEEIK